MKHVIELNGVANINLLLQLETDITRDGQVVMNKEVLTSINKNLENLNRYMIAFCDAVNAGEPTPFWHDILLNPSKYPTNAEKLSIK